MAEFNPDWAVYHYVLDQPGETEVTLKSYRVRGVS